MKIRVADYIADFFVKSGITDLFTITGGGAMHLNDGFAKNPDINCIYNHHEQACAIAAEGYARLTNKIAGVCVTSGPGGTNALTGVLGGWLDSIPMMVISGQVKFSTTVNATNLNLRQLGDQEFNITDCVSAMTKYAALVKKPENIAYHLEKALFLAKHGRPGPVWLDIPLNIQGAIIETEDLNHYNQEEDQKEIVAPVSTHTIDEILKHLALSKKPVVFAGSGIRLSDSYENFLKLIIKLGVPVVTAWNSHDLLPDDHPLNCGRPGTVGTRGGNFVVQNSDLLIVLGSRLNIRQISYNWENFADKAYKIMVDIDASELMKPTLSIDMPVHADVKDVIDKLLDSDYVKEGRHSDWLKWSKEINDKYNPSGSISKTAPIDPYYFINRLFDKLYENEIIVASNGSACVCTFQAAAVKSGQRMFTNSGCASMGYGLPAAIGTAIAERGKRIICIEGDGSIQMNLQELQTVIHNNLNIKIICLNNNGYHSIRQTQRNLFKPPMYGVGPDSGVSFPEFSKLADAYGFEYYRIESPDSIDKDIESAISSDKPSIIEVILDPEKNFEPKLSARRLPDGSMISPRLEDMFPFLSREEMEQNVFNG